MSVFLIATHIALWAVVISLAVIVLGLMRQVGTLLERVSPAGMSSAQSAALKPGDRVDDIKTRSVAGDEVIIGGALEQRAQLIVFVSPMCDVCKAITPLIKQLTLSGAQNLVTTLAVSTADGGDMSPYETITGAALIDAKDVAATFGAVNLPHVVIIREDGRLQTSAPAPDLPAFETLVAPLNAAMSTPEFHAQRLESLV
ncbi:MAG: hypothetical protein AAF221_15500 [Pseudomonadota bacterium]